MMCACGGIGGANVVPISQMLVVNLHSPGLGPSVCDQSHLTQQMTHFYVSRGAHRFTERHFRNAGVHLNRFW
jgi:hypothetical protein